MLDVYLSKSPNPYKIHIFLEEAPLPHRMNWIDVTVGDHKTPQFLKINPNGKIPAIVDHAPATGEGPITIFESGAILIYLAEKAGKFLPTAPGPRFDVLKWLFWQVAGMGPMFGQHGHFKLYAPTGNDYALTRYHNEVRRLYGVMNTRLDEADYLGGDYSIADMACYPWVNSWRFQDVDLAAFPAVKRWYDAVGSRPAVRRAYERVEAEAPLKKGTPAEFQKYLFNNHCSNEATPAFR